VTPIARISPHFLRVTPATVWSFIRVETADGMVGWGEATINGQAAAIAEETRRQQDVLRGTIRDPRASLTPLTQGKLGFAVVSAIDQALWDIDSRTAGIPLARHLTESPKTTVPLYANINRGTTDRSPAGFAATAAAAVQAGFAAVKMAPFDGLTPALAGTEEGNRLTRAGLDRIGAAGDAVRGKARLQVDCHWRFTSDAAAAIVPELARSGVVWFECPIPETLDAIPDVRRLRTRSNAAGMELAGLEEVSLLEGFLPWADAYDVMMPDVKYAGGLTETLRIAEQLSARGVGVSLHNPTGSVCHAVSLHVSAAVGSERPLEIQWGETPLLFDLPQPGLPRPEAGGSALPPANGHGATLSTAMLSDDPEGIAKGG
jgi:galactonate dehydratase